ncbi:macrophage mannose receptor 1-like isoform X1 [Mercenaria mercenaria]|uniref:macrophage mannose receptor 1-like isoform X1 n=1 Tax=Mercenaria mercenaria TaxID=6596 RepID=UPI00234EC1F5|nr:macrophage mannose receptor 1-like isoform X1 [Mercenaria mercenaria]
MFGIITHAIVLTIFQIAFVSADYQCLCNYNVELPVYSNDDSASQLLGYLYEFDCKPIFAKAVKDSGFYQIQFEKKVGYIENGNGIQIQVCRGSIPTDDLVKATIAATLSTTVITITQPLQTNGTTLSLTSSSTDATVQKTTSSQLQSTAQISSTNTTIPTTRSKSSTTSTNTSQSSATSTSTTTHSTTSSTTARRSTTISPSITRFTTTPPSTARSTTMPHSITRSTTTLPSTARSTTTPPSTARSTTMPHSTTRSTTTQPSTTRSTTTLPSTTRSSTMPPSTIRSSTIPPSTRHATTTPPSTPPTVKSTTTKSTTVHTTAKPTCPSGWTMYGTSCYLFHTSSKRHWDDANNDCVSKHSHLAIIETSDEFSFIKHQLQHLINTDNHHTSDTSAWVAGRDHNNEGTWEWYDGLTNTYKQFTYTHWGHDEPDAGDGEHDEDCMTMVGHNGFKWADYSCDENMLYVCEQSALLKTPNPPKQTHGQDCPSGWVMDHGSCYFFQTSGRLTWSEANNDCVTKMSHLVVIDTATEFSFLKGQLDQRIDSHISDDSDTSTWTAGRDNRHEGQWEWYNGFTNTYKPVVYKHWGHDEPNSESGNEDCIAMVAHKSYKWADYDCDQKMFHVCEQSPLTLMTTHTQSPPKQTHGAYCPSGWIQNYGSCYLFHMNSHSTWHDANAYCSRHHAHLAIIETSREDNFLKEESSKRIPDGKHDSNSGVWVAGSDDDSEGRWEWLDGFSQTSKPMEGYSNWHHGEPDSGDGDHDEDCMCLIGDRYEWQDFRCDKHMYFVCEKSITYAVPLVG